MSANLLKRLRVSGRAFTLVEVLAVLAGVTLLVCLCLPAFARVRGQTTRAQCAANLRQFDLAYRVYGGDHNALLPSLPAGVGFSGPEWPWDMPVSIASLLAPYGAQRQQMYCPANTSQNMDGLWNYGLEASDPFRVIGYAFTLGGAAAEYTDDENTTLSARSLTVTGDPAFGSIGSTYVVNPTRRVLVADVVLSLSGQNNPSQEAAYQWINIPGGYSSAGWPGHRTSHLNGNLPAGGNLGMLDGHVEWRPFTNMTSHVSPTTGAPNFWW